MAKKKSYIEEMGVEDIHSLVKDYTLEDQGYTIFYIIDSFDLISFSFPFSRYKNETVSSKTEFILDGLLAYRYLLFDYKYKCILPNEYIGEVLNYREWIKSNVDQVSTVLDSIKESIDEKVKKFGIKEIENIRTLLRENIKFFSVFLSGNFTKSALDQFDDILSKRLMISEFDSESIDDNYLNSIFKDTKPELLYKDIFKSYVDFEETRNIKNNKRLGQNFLSLIRDAKVIDRIISINKKMQKDNKKYVFLYVSSTPLRTPQIIKILKKNNLLPQVSNFQDFEFIRDKHEIYLRFLIDNYSSSSKGRLKLLHELLQGAELADAVNSGMKQKGYKSEFKRRLQKMANITRSSLESTLLIRRFEKAKDDSKTYEQYKDNLLNNFLGSDIVNDPDELYQLIDSIFILFKNQNYEELTNSTAILHKTTHALNVELVNYNAEKLSKDKRRGSDFVIGNFQHFPSLLFFRYKPNKTLFSLVTKLSDLYSLPLSNQLGFADTWSLMIEVFSSRTLTEENRIEEIILAKLYILSIIPGDVSDVVSSSSISEPFILEGLNEVLLLIEGQLRLNPDSVDNLNLQHEIYYFLIWTLRRHEKYNHAISVANQALETYTNSPRLHQGLALAYTSKFYLGYLRSQRIDTISNKIVVIAINNLNKSLKGYLSIIEEANKNETGYDLILKNVASIRNTLSDMLIKRYLFSGDESFLKESRKELLLVRKICKQLKINYNLLASFNHTELDLEISELKHLMLTKATKYKITDKRQHLLNRFEIISSTLIYEIPPKIFEPSIAAYNKIIAMTET